MIKKLFLFILLLSHPLLSQNTEAARKLLDEVSGKISSFKNIKFDFTYVLENRPENILLYLKMKKLQSVIQRKNLSLELIHLRS